MEKTIVCIKLEKIGGGNYVNLTIGKKYTSYDFTNDDFLIGILDDSGDKLWYPKKNFLSLESYREKKLTDLGI
jgi:hypothetical protein